MQIKDLKELKKLLQLCRTMGVEAMEIDGIKFNLGALPTKKTRSVKDITSEMFPEANIPVPSYSPLVQKTIEDKIKTDELTEEQLLMYSVREDEAQTN